MSGSRWVQIFAVLSLAGALTLPCLAQSEGPLYLDVRPGEDLFLIDVTEMTQQYPRQAVREYHKAIDQAGKGERGAAVEHFKNAILLAPDFFSAHNNLGVLYQKMVRYPDAEKQYIEASKLNPRSAAPLVNLGSLYIEESMSPGAGDSFARRSILNNALRCLNTALEIQPSSPFGHYLTGVVYYLTGFYEEAVSHFERVVNAREVVGFGRIALANVYLKMQEWENAVLQLDAYLTEHPFASNRSLVRKIREQAREKLEKLKEIPQ